MEEKLILICDLLIENNVTQLEWERMKYFIDLQYKNEIAKVTFTGDKDNLKQQIKNTCFYSIGSTHSS